MLRCLAHLGRQLTTPRVSGSGSTLAGTLVPNSSHQGFIAGFSRSAAAFGLADFFDWNEREGKEPEAHGNSLASNSILVSSHSINQLLFRREGMEGVRAAQQVLGGPPQAVVGTWNCCKLTGDRHLPQLMSGRTPLLWPAGTCAVRSVTCY
jgi:hypothetical protein